MILGLIDENNIIKKVPYVERIQKSIVIKDKINFLENLR